MLEKLNKVNIKELILILAEKVFPLEWNELNKLIEGYFTNDINNVITNCSQYNFICDLFFSLLKQHNKKRLSSSRQKLFKLKSAYLDLYCPFYEKLIFLFNKSYQDIKDLSQLLNFMDLMIISDKILLLLIDCFYNLNEFFKEEKLLLLIKVIIDKLYFLAGEVVKTNNKEILSNFHMNIYKIIKYLSKIQSTGPILFFQELDRYIKFLFTILIECELFSNDCIKVTLHALTKVVNTQFYREINESELIESGRSGTGDMGDLYNNNSTPEKKRFTNSLSILVSPTKLKNYESEIVISNEKYQACFKYENISILIDNLYKKVYLKLKKENEEAEIDLIIELGNESF